MLYLVSSEVILIRDNVVEMRIVKVSDGKDGLSSRPSLCQYRIDLLLYIYQNYVQPSLECAK